MATIIDNVVEPVIEDPVVDILAESTETAASGKGSAVASQVPALNLGPVSRRGRPHQSGDAVLPEERFSDASDPNKSAADPGRDTLPEPGNFIFPPRSGTIIEAGSAPGPFGLSSFRSSPPSNTGNSPSNGGGENSDGVAPDTSSDSDDDMPPNEVPDESGGSEHPAETGGDEHDPNEAAQPDTVPGATVFGTEGDDIIDVKFVFPAEVRTEPGTLNGTTHNADVVTGNRGDDAINGGGEDVPFFEILGNRFSHLNFEVGPLWFLEALLLFTLVYVACRITANRFLSGFSFTPYNSGFPTKKAVFISIAVIAMGTFIVRIKFPVGAEIYHFQVGHYVHYAFCFWLGTLAYQGKWFEGLTGQAGRFWTKVALATLIVLPLIVGTALAFKIEIDHVLGGFSWLTLIYSIWESFACLRIIISLLYFFQKRFDSQSRLLSGISKTCDGQNESELEPLNDRPFFLIEYRDIFIAKSFRLPFECYNPSILRFLICST